MTILMPFLKLEGVLRYAKKPTFITLGETAKQGTKKKGKKDEGNIQK